MADGERRPLIFISYSHKDEEAKAFVHEHLDALKNLGVAEIWEDRQLVVGDAWYDSIKSKLEDCAVAVLLVSRHFLKSEFCIREEVKILLEERKRRGMLIAPILLRPCAWKLFPWLAAIQMWPRDSQPLLALDEIGQDEVVTEVVLAIHGFLEKPKERTQRVVSIDMAIESDSALPVSVQPKIDLIRLPTSGYEVVGRDKELQFLNEAFDGDRLNVVSLRAWGGGRQVDAGEQVVRVSRRRQLSRCAPRFRVVLLQPGLQ